MIQGHQIYVIATVRDGQHSALTKIGISRNAKSRLAALRTASAQEIALAFAFDARSKVRARQIEVYAHKELARFRLAGEWFDLHPAHAVMMLLTSVQLHLMGAIVTNQQSQVAFDKLGLTEALRYCEGQIPGIVLDDIVEGEKMAELLAQDRRDECDRLGLPWVSR